MSNNNDNNNNNRNEKENIGQQINLLNNRLRELTIERNRTEQQLRELQRQQEARNQRRLRENRDRALRRQRETDRRLAQAPRDRFNKIIVLGDKVRFLTKGLFRSTEGIVTKINKLRITARDSTGRLINRNPENVEIIEDSDSSEVDSDLEITAIVTPARGKEYKTKKYNTREV